MRGVRILCRRSTSPIYRRHLSTEEMESLFFVGSLREQLETHLKRLPLVSARLQESLGREEETMLR